MLSISVLRDEQMIIDGAIWNWDVEEVIGGAKSRTRYLLMKSINSHRIGLRRALEMFFICSLRAPSPQVKIFCWIFSGINSVSDDLPLILRGGFSWWVLLGS